MSIITSILHCYGLLISEESVTLMQQYILPLWEKTKPELYEMFSTKSDNDEFFDYLLDHYAICYNTFWGTVNGYGENHLGRILMDIRAKLQFEC